MQNHSYAGNCWERGKFFESNPLLSDGIILLLNTQEFVLRMRQAGIDLEIDFTVFITDESDYIRVDALDPLRQDKETKEQMRQELEKFLDSFTEIVRAALGDQVRKISLNIGEELMQKSETIARIDEVAQDVLQSSNWLENEILERRTRSRLYSLNSPEGFYGSAAKALGISLSYDQARTMAARQIATYRLQYADMQGNGKAVAFDTSACPDRARMVSSQ